MKHILIFVWVTVASCISITTLQNMFCKNCQTIIQTAANENKCGLSKTKTKYTKFKKTTSKSEDDDFVYCSHVNQCLEMCGKKRYVN